MAYAEKFDQDQSTEELRKYAKKATDVAAEAAQSTKQEARTLVDNVVEYTKSNPMQAVAIAAGIAFVAGSVILAPRLLRGQIRDETREEQIQRLLRDAYREAEHIRDNSTTWNRLTDWVKANLPATR